MEKMYRDIFRPSLEKFGVAAGDQPFVFAYYFSGVAAVIMKWVQLGCEKPMDEVIALITTFLPRVEEEGARTE